MKAKLQDIPGMGKETAKLLRRAGLTSIESIAVSSDKDICSITNITEYTAKKIINGARQMVGMEPNPITMDTVLIDLLDLPDGKMAYVYVKGYLVIQTKCTKEEAEEQIQTLNRLTTLEKQLLVQLERAEQVMKASENRDEEIKQLEKKVTAFIKKEKQPDSMYV